MASTLQDLVIVHLQDAYAMEQNVLGMLDSMIATTDDPQMKGLLQAHRAETQVHGQRVEGRLKELGHTTSMAKNAGAAIGGLFKSMMDTMRSEKGTKNLRDGFVTEHLEIAGYELLERYANRAGDSATAAVARQNKQEEERMAKRLDDQWDRAVDHDLAAQGVAYDGTGAQTGAYGAKVDAAERGNTWTGSSTDADMGMGFHSDRAATQTNTDQLEANIPQSTSDTTARSSVTTPRNP